MGGMGRGEGGIYFDYFDPSPAGCNKFVLFANKCLLHMDLDMSPWVKKMTPVTRANLPLENTILLNGVEVR